MFNRQQGGQRKLHAWAAAGLIGVAVGLVMPSAGHGATFVLESEAGLGLGIPDDGYDGSTNPGSVVSHSLTLDTGFGPSHITGIDVTVAIDHAVISDLTLILETPGGQMLYLMDRPGLPPGGEDGGAGGGSYAAFSSDSPITFDADAEMSIEFAGWFGDGVLEGVFAPYASGGFLQTPAGLTGELLEAGPWTLHVGDSNASIEGGLESWSLAISTVPEPGSLALLGLGTLACLGRCRRRAGHSPT